MLEREADLIEEEEFRLNAHNPTKYNDVKLSYVNPNKSEYLKLKELVQKLMTTTNMTVFFYIFCLQYSRQ